MLPGPLRRVLADPDTVRGGISAAAGYGSELMASDRQAELYVSLEVLRQLRQQKRINSDTDSPNVVLRVPLFPMRMLNAGGNVMPVAVVAADLLESGEPRSARAAHHLLAGR